MVSGEPSGVPAQVIDARSMMMETAQAAETPPGMDRPRTGAYYWLPLPGDAAVRWDVITCHDLGRRADVGHLRLWPEVVRRLAQAWGKDSERLVHRLGEHYAGLPRGRVTRVRGVYLVQHGDDTPTVGGPELIEGRFGLVGRRVRQETSRIKVDTFRLGMRWSAG